MNKVCKSHRIHTPDRARRTSGFALLSALVIGAVSIASIGSLLVLSNKALLSSRNSRAEMGLRILESNIISSLAENEQACGSSLKDENGRRVRYRHSSYRQGQQNRGRGRDDNFDPATTPPSSLHGRVQRIESGATVLAEVNQSTETYKIDSIELEHISGPTSRPNGNDEYVTSLQISVQKRGAQARGNISTLIRPANLRVETDNAGEIVACKVEGITSNPGQGGGSQKREICEALGYTWTSNECRIRNGLTLKDYYLAHAEAGNISKDPTQYPQTPISQSFGTVNWPEINSGIDPFSTSAYNTYLEHMCPENQFVRLNGTNRPSCQPIAVNKEGNTDFETFSLESHACELTDYLSLFVRWRLFLGAGYYPNERNRDVSLVFTPGSVNGNPVFSMSRGFDPLKWNVNTPWCPAGKFPKGIQEWHGRTMCCNPIRSREANGAPLIKPIYEYRKFLYSRTHSSAYNPQPQPHKLSCPPGWIYHHMEAPHPSTGPGFLATSIFHSGDPNTSGTWSTPPPVNTYGPPIDPIQRPEVYNVCARLIGVEPL